MAILICSLLTRSGGTWAFSAVYFTLQSQPLCIRWRLTGSRDGCFCKNTSTTGVDKRWYKLTQHSLLLEAESTSFSGHYCWLQPCFPPSWCGWHISGSHGAWRIFLWEWSSLSVTSIIAALSSSTYLSAAGGRRGKDDGTSEFKEKDAAIVNKVQGTWNLSQKHTCTQGIKQFWQNKNGSTSKLSVSLTHWPNWPVWLETLSARHTFNLDCSQNERSLLAGWIIGGRQSWFREESPWGFAAAQGSQGKEESEQKSAGDSAIAGLWNNFTHFQARIDSSFGLKGRCEFSRDKMAVGSVGIVGEVKTNLKSGSKI